MKREHRFPSMIKSIFRDTIQNIQRNNLMSFASVVSVVFALLILGTFIVITINVNNIANTMVKSLELKVFLENSADQTQIDYLEQELKDNENITGFTFEPKEEALARYSERLEDYSGLLEGFNNENNPVSNSFTVSVSSPEVLDQVKEEIEDLQNPAVSYVKYGEEYIDAIMMFHTFSNYVCLAVLAVLSIISVVVIYNTIKLTCYSNRKEIEIMKFVGADDWYIKLPFFIEGLLLGILGAVCATLILSTLYTYLIGITNTLVTLPLESELVAPTYVILPVLLFSAIYGIIMGAFGSLFSIRKYFYA